MFSDCWKGSATSVCLECLIVLSSSELKHWIIYSLSPGSDNIQGLLNWHTAMLCRSEIIHALQSSKEVNHQWSSVDKQNKSDTGDVGACTRQSTVISGRPLSTPPCVSSSKNPASVLTSHSCCSCSYVTLRKAPGTFPPSSQRAYSSLLFSLVSTILLSRCLNRQGSASGPHAMLFYSDLQMLCVMLSYHFHTCTICWNGFQDLGSQLSTLFGCNCISILLCYVTRWLSISAEHLCILRSEEIATQSF